MKNKMLWISFAMPLVVTLVVLSFLPEQIPAHYDFAGNVDRWGSKYESLILPVMILLSAGLWQWVIGFYQKKQQGEPEERQVQYARQNEKVIRKVAYGTLVIFSILQAAILYNGISMLDKGSIKGLDANLVSCCLIGLMMIVFGNLMPKSKQNALFGLRTPWSTKSDEVWAVCQRRSGKVMVISGILVMAVALLVGGIASSVFLLVALFVEVVFGCVDSYWVYRKIEKGSSKEQESH